ncbi:MAG: hypothetical protein JSW43_03855 [Gemmatimonadota bacterium]|nr:MAG: hypothetical protein JSW43_03855 [Gemmatimonadota bacterium]
MRCTRTLMLLLGVTFVTSCSDGLDPARDLSGLWLGTGPNGMTYQDNVDNPNCVYEGDVRITLIQDGTALTGSFNLTVRESTKLLQTSLPCVPVGASSNQALFGSVNGTTVEFGLTDLITSFSGTFTSDILTGTISSSSSTGIRGTLRAVRD